MVATDVANRMREPSEVRSGRGTSAVQRPEDEIGERREMRKTMGVLLTVKDDT